MSEPAPSEPIEPPATAARTATEPPTTTASATSESSSPGAEPATVPPPKRTLKERLAAHFAEYGRVAIVTYLVLSLMTIIGFSIAIGIGAEPSTATGFLGVIGAGWLAAKATMPLRILAVLAVTPPIAALIVRRKARRLGHEASE